MSTSPSHALPLWSAVTLACLALLSLSILPTTSAAPAKHTTAPKDLINAMSISESSPLPLQLQIEARVAGAQKLAYLPTTGPSMDFYYLNYRPTYRAGESTIDFWMLTPEGSKAPRSGSLELYDEFGRVRLAILAPEGTEIPQAIANKHEPFLWKSWKVPRTLQSDFDFSEKFRIILRTSEAQESVASVVATNEKRWDSDDTLVDFLLVRNKNKNKNKNKNEGDTNANANDKDNDSGNDLAATKDPKVVQDRQFRIKGLKATPGGKPNPAKMNVNSVAVQTTTALLMHTNSVHSYNNHNDPSRHNTNANPDLDAGKFAHGQTSKAATYPKSSDKPLSGAAFPSHRLVPAMTLLVVCLSALASLC
ncbi:hypothetical protein BC939DRAFT_435213 [Gamsiella multidivaricata]|uniref:uncharacterized protein n=1 Tax=Gamsiella multidivaricata TaxID=101098 RepID=UPI00221E7FBA|nr:uncharacterized protein BC939DRAFT_435213 [Gamsiella multidivaricata]KAG0350051.1 hypothetical protein BGZ54_004063 [Gamsiella multidivaricata]KAI7832330.1 hypothetical protein BC939DRAFT_435213 [Gamsiella multidivaricata]